MLNPPKKHVNRAQTPAAMVSCFGLVLPRQLAQLQLPLNSGLSHDRYQGDGIEREMTKAKCMHERSC